MRAGCRRSTAVLALACLAIAACATRPVGIPLPATPRIDSDLARYGRLEAHKALAIAGDPMGRYAAGYAFGLASAEEARTDALRRCAERRADLRIDAPCRLYAVGDELHGDPN